MNKFIPLSVPNLKGRELEYITKAIETEWVSTGGKFINDFENNMARYLNIDKSIACQSGTAGLHLALKLAGVECGDEVIVPTLTFIAAVNPARYLGAEPVFMDCDDTLNMDLDKLEEFCNEQCIVTEKGLMNSQTKKIIKAIIIVHVFGNMGNMVRLIEIAKNYNLKVIEDATEALGTYYTSGKYEGKFAGTIGDFGVYSFNGNKIITTGGGGMLVAKDSNLADKARYLSTQAKDDELRFIHNEVGFNYRMTNLQAALGVAQLEQLEGFIETKRNNYELYKSLIDKIDGLELMGFNEGIRPNYWFYSLIINKDKFGIDRDSVLQKLRDLKIQTRPIWGLINEQRPYIKNQSYSIEKANVYIDKILNIPCSSSLTKDDVEYIVKMIGNLER